ncbi:septal ring lytic transglycosylase RlpA family protein [Pseudovibrio japonicus]|uniref:septal ring lytic transglycosylase RlpA family protein n=1 Tax=Pseudovibrio japonicus TaxID=366534 RepID=UPI002810F8FD|nr:septal ring lytic transglycosylase RlpA family protein [Pseudovibrio japonicus]
MWALFGSCGLQSQAVEKLVPQPEFIFFAAKSNAPAKTAFSPKEIASLKKLGFLWRHFDWIQLRFIGYLFNIGSVCNELGYFRSIKLKSVNAEHVVSNNGMTSLLNWGYSVKAPAPQTIKRVATSISVVALCAGIAACGGGTDKVKFSEKKYGVAASPRVVKGAKPVPKGGGRYVVGKPYKVAGKWYYPKKDENYKKTGKASWYGPTFHGRKTANGEVFDRNALTAAHPTMPLPSYAKVTNLQNGRSMVVRVNDRGPFHDNRVIDLSERVAGMLGTKSSGVAKVRVEYVGRAPLHGKDEKKLLASYSGNGGGFAPRTMFAFANPVNRISGPAPTPRSRPYDAPTLAAQNVLAFNANQIDPAVIYERSMSATQVASIGNFRNRINNALAISANPNTPEPALAVQPVSSTFGSSLLPPPSTGVYKTPSSSSAPTFQTGNAISSYVSQQRLNNAYEAFESISGGSGLKDLLLSRTGQNH